MFHATSIARPGNVTQVLLAVVNLCINANKSFQSKQEVVFSITCTVFLPQLLLTQRSSRLSEAATDIMTLLFRLEGY